MWELNLQTIWKLGSDNSPRVDNQTSGKTLQDLTRPLLEKSPSASYPPMGNGASFWWWDALPHHYHMNVVSAPVGYAEMLSECANSVSQ